MMNFARSSITRSSRRFGSRLARKCDTDIAEIFAEMQTAAAPVQREVLYPSTPFAVIDEQPGSGVGSRSCKFLYATVKDISHGFKEQSVFDGPVTKYKVTLENMRNHEIVGCRITIPDCDAEEIKLPSLNSLIQCTVSRYTIVNWKPLEGNILKEIATGEKLRSELVSVVMKSSLKHNLTSAEVLESSRFAYDFIKFGTTEE